MKLDNRLILLFILLVSAVLRFYDLMEIPLTHDEFSAIFRTRFNSFHELIQGGVIKDGHPAGVQVFLYYWINWVGEVDWLIKLPFLLAGVGSVYLVFKIGELWFSETTGLLSATAVCGAQFTVMYSQIARPYASGLFLTLLMVYFWSLIIQKPEKKYNRNLLFYILFSAFCAYNHYFSLLVAFILGIAGLFFVQKTNLKKYILAGVGIFILFLPHWKIFMTHLSISGLTWLGKPGPDFFLSYLKFGLNFFEINYILMGIALVYGTVNYSDLKYKKRILLALSLYLLPMLIGYFYSVYRTPVLQYSILIFSFPFLFIALFGLVKSLQPKWNFLLVCLLMLSNVYSLVMERNHYSVFYDSCFIETLREFQDVKKEFPRVHGIIELDEEISSTYIKRLDLKGDFKNFKDFSSMGSFQKYISSLKGIKHLYFSGMYDVNATAIPIIMEYFPRVVKQKNFQGATTFLFTKGQPSGSQTISSVNFNDPDVPGWNMDQKDQLIVDRSNNVICHVSKEKEFPKSYETTLAELNVNKNDFLDISVDVNLKDEHKDIVLVASMENGNKNIFWRGANSIKLIHDDHFEEGWSRLRNSFIFTRKMMPNEEVDVNIYIWNKGGHSFDIDNINISVRKGNPILYGHIEDF